MNTVNTPFIHCYVKREFLTNFSAKGNEVEECYIFAVTCITCRPPLFTCHTEKGGIYSRLPLHAFRALDWKSTEASDYGPREDLLQALVPWSCVGNLAQVIEYSYLKGYDLKTRNLGIGTYLFTIDYFDGNFSEDPEQHKTHNVIQLDSGLFAALPNNYITAQDAHFTKQQSPIDYKRQSKVWRTK